MKEEIYEIPNVPFLLTREKLQLLVTRVLVILNRLDLQGTPCEYIETTLAMQTCFMDDARYAFNREPIQFRYSNISVVNQVFSEEDPYGEEDWEGGEDDVDSELILVGHIFQKFVIVNISNYGNKVIYFKDFNGELLYTIRIDDPDNILYYEDWNE